MGIAAALSGDAAMLEAYRSGDLYLSFAKRAGAGAARTRPRPPTVVRDRCKAVVLGTLYGMGPETLARRIGARRARPVSCCGCTGRPTRASGAGRTTR